jgi:hypothetical protein
LIHYARLTVPFRHDRQANQQCNLHWHQSTVHPPRKESHQPENEASGSHDRGAGKPWLSAWNLDTILSVD